MFKESKISTFKMRIVNFEEMWETNFILYSIPFLLNSMRYLNLLVIYIYLKIFNSILNYKKYKSEE